MWPYRPARALGVLTTLITIAHFVVWFGGTIVLLGAPAVKLLDSSQSAHWTFGLPVGVEVRNPEAVLGAGAGGRQIKITNVRGSLQLAIPAMSWELFAVVWAYLALTFALMVLFLHHLRAVLRRTRDGAPFHPDNAGRLRLLGLLLLALAALQTVGAVLTSLALQNGLRDSRFRVPTGIQVDETLVVFGLVLLTLAEIFRRGAELEHEQSLVV